MFLPPTFLLLPLLLLLLVRQHNFPPDGAATNKQHGTSLNTAKLDRETEELKHEKVTVDVGRLIQKGRQGKGWTQKDLATVSVCVCVCVLDKSMRLHFSISKAAVNCVES